MSSIRRVQTTLATDIVLRRDRTGFSVIRETHGINVTEKRFATLDAAQAYFNKLVAVAGAVLERELEGEE